MKIAPADLRIRHAELADVEAVHEVMSMPKAYAGTLQLPMASLEVRRERMGKVDPNGARLVAEVRDPSLGDGRFRVIGTIGLDPSGPSLRRRHAMGLGMAVHDDWQGRGVGSALMGAVIDRADNWMNVLRIELTVFTDNHDARALYERFGFVVEGTHRAYALRAGEYADVYAMARLHPRPPTLPIMAKE